MNYPELSALPVLIHFNAIGCSDVDFPPIQETKFPDFQYEKKITADFVSDELLSGNFNDPEKAHEMFMVNAEHMSTESKLEVLKHISAIPKDVIDQDDFPMEDDAIKIKSEDAILPSIHARDSDSAMVGNRSPQPVNNEKQLALMRLSTEQQIKLLATHPSLLQSENNFNDDAKSPAMNPFEDSENQLPINSDSAPNPFEVNVVGKQNSVKGADALNPFADPKMLLKEGDHPVLPDNSAMNAVGGLNTKEKNLARLDTAMQMKMIAESESKEEEEQHVIQLNHKQLKQLPTQVQIALLNNLESDNLPPVQNESPPPQANDAKIDDSSMINNLTSSQIQRCRLSTQEQLELLTQDDQSARQEIKSKKNLLAEMSPKDIERCRLPTSAQMELFAELPTDVKKDPASINRPGYLTDSEIRRKSIDEQMKIAVELSKKDSFRGGAAIPSPSTDFKAMEVRDTQTNISGRRDRGLARENPDGPAEFAEEDLNLKEMTDSERLAYAMKESYHQSQSNPAVDIKQEAEESDQVDLSSMSEMEQMAYLMNMSAEDPVLEKKKSEQMSKLESMTDAERMAYVMNMTSDPDIHSDEEENHILVPPDLHKMTSEEQMQYVLTMSANQNVAFPKSIPEEPSFMICITLNDAAHVINVKPHIETYWTLWERISSQYSNAINGRQFTFQYKGENIDMDQFGASLADSNIEAGDELVVVFV